MFFHQPEILSCYSPSVFAKILGDNPTFIRSHTTLPVIEANRSQWYHTILPCLLFDGTVGGRELPVSMNEERQTEGGLELVFTEHEVVTLFPQGGSFALLPRVLKDARTEGRRETDGTSGTA